MKVLVTGSGKSGSWQIRGEQLGMAVGATVIPNARDVAAFDLVVCVKRVSPELVDRVRAAGVPLVWDVVDAWPQPAGNEWTEEQCRAWLKARIEQIKPDAIVTATKAMAADCGGFFLPHHARPSLERNPIRREVQTVGYEGGDYLGRWRAMVEAECERRGWVFVVNPARLADVDIVVALRDAAGYAPRHWKSAVKLSNAQGSGTPFIGNREAGYLEQAIGTAEKWADTPEELKAAFDALTPHKERARAAGWMHAAAPTLSAVAQRYATWLAALKF